MPSAVSRRQHHIVGRVPVCLYPIDQRARACAHRTGFSRSGRSASLVRLRLGLGSASSGEQARPLARDLRLVYLLGTMCVRRWKASFVCVGPDGLSHRRPGLSVPPKGLEK
jgi:hypothetical protein